MKYQIKMMNCKNAFLLLLCLSLMNCKKNFSTDIIEFDVNGNYPLKTLDIQDIANIEYLTLEINDDFLFSGLISMTDNYIICSTAHDYLFFDKSNGKPVSKVSRHGNGPEEYNFSIVPVYSEKKDELFLYDLPGVIKVYGKDGTFKRKFSIENFFYPRGARSMYDYDEEHLLLNGSLLSNSQKKDTTFMLISKQDGSMKKIFVPFEKKIDLIMIEGIAAHSPNTCFAVRNGKDYLLTDYSSDTVYRFTPEQTLIPVLTRIPSIQEMEIKILLHSWLETDKYLFFSTVKLEYDFNTRNGFPAKGYLMEKRSGKFYQTNIQMRDYKGKELIICPLVTDATPNQQNGIITLKASELIAANEDNKLSGKLKEATDHLAEDDEYIFMILKFK